MIKIAKSLKGTKRNQLLGPKMVYWYTHLGSDVILGPPQPVSIERTPLGIPIEQSISRQRLRPGSGSLCVRVTTDGPTRVLQVIDVNKPSNVSNLKLY